MKDGTKSLIPGIIAVFIWSTVATAFKITLRSMDPLTMVFIASVFSVIAILLTSVLLGKLGEIAGMPRRQMLSSMALGILNPFLYYIVLFGSYDLLPAQIAQSINYSWPLLLTVLSLVFLGQKARWRSLAGICLGFFGVIVVSTRGFSPASGDFNPLGMALAAFSALLWSIFWTVNLGSKGSVESRLFFNFLGGSIIISLALLVRGSQVPDLSGWLSAAYVGIFEMGITFLIWMKALSFAKETARISMLIYLGPFFSLVLIGTVLGEPILFTTVAGLLFIVAGLFVQGRAKRDG